MEIRDERLSEVVGSEIFSTSALLAYLAIIAGAAAIYKIVTSARGRVKIPGLEINWGD